LAGWRRFTVSLLIELLNYSTAPPHIVNWVLGIVLQQPPMRRQCCYWIIAKQYPIINGRNAGFLWSSVLLLKLSVSRRGELKKAAGRNEPAAFGFAEFLVVGSADPARAAR
jgi:hypothetical protein